jgi:hypothetical protein
MRQHTHYFRRPAAAFPRHIISSPSQYHFFSLPDRQVMFFLSLSLLQHAGYFLRFFTFSLSSRCSKQVLTSNVKAAWGQLPGGEQPPPQDSTASNPPQSSSFPVSNPSHTARSRIDSTHFSFAGADKHVRAWPPPTPSHWRMGVLIPRSPPTTPCIGLFQH